MADAMEKVRPELRTIAAAARNAHSRARAAGAEERKQMNEVKAYLIRLRAQGVSTWTLAAVLGVSQSRIRRMTDELTGRTA